MNARELWREQTALMWAADGALCRAHAAFARPWRRRPRACGRERLGRADHIRAAGAVPPHRRHDGPAVRRPFGLRRVRARDPRRRRGHRSADARRRDGVDDRHRQLRVRYRQSVARRRRESALRRLVGPHGALSGRRHEHLRAALAGAPALEETTGIDLVRQLLASGVEVDPQLNMHRPGRGGNSARFTDYLLTTGATPLLRAAITHDHEAMRSLARARRRVDLPNVMGVTPLMAAAGVGVRNINFGANRSPDFEADKEIESKAIASLEILLAAGANINSRVTDTKSRTARIARPSAITDGDGQTALFSAASRGWIQVVQFLVDHGAEVDIVDQLGKSPLDLALARVGGRVVEGSDTVAEILRGAAD